MMKNTIIYLMMFLISVNASDIISYNIENINCEVIPHKYNEYYQSPCETWRKKMNKNDPHNMIQCITSIDGDTGKQMHGCKPSFGSDSDTIKVRYYFEKIQECSAINKTCSTSKYNITAKTQLNNPLHPTTAIIILIVFVCMIILSCSIQETHRSYNGYEDAFFGAYIGAQLGGGGDYDNSTFTWTFDN